MVDFLPETDRVSMKGHGLHVSCLALGDRLSSGRRTWTSRLAQGVAQQLLLLLHCHVPVCIGVARVLAHWNIRWPVGGAGESSFKDGLEQLPVYISFDRDLKYVLYYVVVAISGLWGRSLGKYGGGVVSGTAGRSQQDNM